MSVPDEGYSKNVPDEGYSRNVPDEGYSRNVPDEGYSRNVPDEGYSRNVPDEGYSRNVPDEGYSKNASYALNLISTFLFNTYVHFCAVSRFKICVYLAKAEIDLNSDVFNMFILPIYRNSYYIYKRNMCEQNVSVGFSVYTFYLLR